MMRNLFIASTLLFWIAVGGFWTASAWHPEPVKIQITVVQSYSLKELKEHNTEDDCWMAINNQVYELTEYLPSHPTKLSMLLPWCGKEATHAYRTKTRGRTHSAYADQLLPMYQIGLLEQAP